MSSSCARSARFAIFVQKHVALTGKFKGSKVATCQCTWRIFYQPCRGRKLLVLLQFAPKTFETIELEHALVKLPKLIARRECGCL